jgi:hypothetical protein
MALSLISFQSVSVTLTANVFSPTLSSACAVLPTARARSVIVQSCWTLLSIVYAVHSVAFNVMYWLERGRCDSLMLICTGSLDR